MNTVAAKPLIRRDVEWPVRFGPLAAALVVPFATPPEPKWAVMWTTAAAIWLACKWAMAFGNTRTLSPRHRAAYWLLWPGMDPKPFDTRTQTRPPLGAWIQGGLFVGVGALLVFLLAPTTLPQSTLLAGWLGWIGFILLLHFGVFHVLATALQRVGIPVQPLMQNPLLATSLADFWGRRWNHAFQEVAHRQLFKPVARRAGAAVATMVVFFVSGLIHEWVITIPARGGYGLPTLYFLIQGAGLLVERSHPGRLIGLGRGVAGRCFALVVAAAPVVVLFPPPFLREVIAPLIRVLTKS